MSHHSNGRVEESGKIAFVICPIGETESEIRKRSDQILNHIITPVVAERGYKAIRADQISEPGIITSQVINHLINDDLVIADLTGHNPNVFYELAIRHAIKKPVVQMIQKGESIPFDVSTSRTISIDHKDLDSVAEAKKELIKQIQAVEKDPAKVDSPISMAVDLQVLKRSQNPQLKIMADLRSMMNELNHAIFEINDKLDTMIIERNSHIARKPRFYPGISDETEYEMLRKLNTISKYFTELSDKASESKKRKSLHQKKSTTKKG
jgi:hypothetical protein